MLRDIANSKNPLAALIEAALRSKGADLTSQTVARYEQLMSAAIRMDDGEQLDGGPWAAFLADFPDGSKVQGAVEAIGVSIGASSSEITQFVSMSEGVAAIRAGDDPDVVEELLHAEFEAMEETEPEPYSHLNEESRAFMIAVDDAMGEDPERPEPQPFIEAEASYAAMRALPRVCITAGRRSFWKRARSALPATPGARRPRAVVAA
jgi:hypothetical protein